MGNSGVFISHRRQRSWKLAELLEGVLQSHGLGVYVRTKAVDEREDADALVLREIASRDHFIILIAPGTAASMFNPEDEMRRELRYALLLDKNIIPVTTRGVDLPTLDVPPDVREVTKRIAVRIARETIVADIMRLISIINTPDTGSVQTLPAPPPAARETREVQATSPGEQRSLDSFYTTAARVPVDASATRPATATFRSNGAGTLRICLHVNQEANTIFADFRHNPQVVVGRGPAMPEASSIDLSQYPHFMHTPADVHFLSRRHFALLSSKGNVYITDLGSRNGTLVNGNPLFPDQPRILKTGDTIEAGPLIITAEILDDTAEMNAQPASDPKSGRKSRGA